MLKYFVLILLASNITAQTYIFDGSSEVQQYGVYELKINLSEHVENPYREVELKVLFKKPDGNTVVVDGFYDGNDLFKARAYCSLIGKWQYRTQSNIKEMNGLSGEFEVKAASKKSSLKGKLRVSPQDSGQFIYDNGDWFLHIGDTGYRYAALSEPFWKEYIDQSVEMGTTKIRVWFCEKRHTVENLLSADRQKINLSTWQEIEKRLIYALNNYPDLIIQLIPYGEDSEEIRRYNNDDFMAQYIGRYSQARWSSFPNVYWCISNDRIIIKDNPSQKKQKNADNRYIHYNLINKIGHDFKEREAWGTLITNHQARFSGYDFIHESWSEIITLEELDGVDGKRILEFRKKGSHPVINDEDRYALYRNPENRRYFFRRLMWASLLSGGAATYSGGNTWQPYKAGTADGVQGYYTLNRKGFLFQGAHDFKYIHKFFKESGINLINMQPADSLAGNDPYRWKCIHDEQNYIVYLANPDGSIPQKDNPAYERPKVRVKLPHGLYSVRWFDPKSGTWAAGTDVAGGEQEFIPPGKSKTEGDLNNTVWGDWLLWLSRT